MSWRITVVLLLTLLGCSSAVDDQKNRVDIVQKNGGTYTEVCAEKRKLADVYLSVKDAGGYKEAKLDADVTCELAESYPTSKYHADGGVDMVVEEAYNIDAAAAP